jgi:CRISPR system Cascade subunit CasB
VDNTQKKTGVFPIEDIFNWWHEMQPDQEEEGRHNWRGELAELRRCKNVEEIFFVPRFQLLRHKVNPPNSRLLACAAMAGILAHVKTNDAKYHFGEWLGRPKEEGATLPRLSELRFRRLIRVKTLEELFIDLVRVLPLADNAAPVKQLAQDIYFWSDDTRRKWTFDYYDAQAGEEKT